MKTDKLLETRGAQCFTNAHHYTSHVGSLKSKKSLLSSNAATLEDLKQVIR
eukprot:m.41058 g.41058  ORF g.41058 m.41058 type:complete len:51 (-) comp10508_c0_seq1:1564-1716(-)